MLRDFDLTFQRGTLLTGELLSLLYQGPRQRERLLFSGWADGAVSGMRVSAEDGALKVSSGLYLHQGALFCQDNDCILLPPEGAFEDGYEYGVYLEFREERRTANVTERRLEFTVRRQGAHAPQADSSSTPEAPLFGFYGRPRPPAQFKDLFARRFRLLSFPYAAYGEATFLPQVFELVLTELRRKPRKHPLDFPLMNDIIQHGTIPCEMLRAYIQESGLSYQGAHTKEALLKRFGDALEKLHWDWESVGAASSQLESSKRKKEKPLFVE